MGLWWLKIERPSVCYSGGGPQFTVQIHRILAGSAAEEGRIWLVAQDVKHMSINGKYVDSWGPDSLSWGQITGICMAIFSLSDRMPLKGVRQLILQVTFTLFTTYRWKMLQCCCPTSSSPLTWKTHHIFKAPKCLHWISMMGLWINHSHLCSVCNREVHLNSKSQTTYSLWRKNWFSLHRAAQG